METSESNERTGACLFCLKTFVLSTSTSSSSQLVIPYEARVISPTSRLGFVAPAYSSPTVCPEVEKSSSAVDDGSDVACHDIYTRFLHLSSRYLKLATTTDVFIRAAQDRKNATGELVQAFCASCRELLCFVCDLHAELQAVKLRLIWKLEQVEEIMANGRNRISGKLFKGLLKMLMGQLNVKTRIRVEVFRKMFQLKCKSKGANSAPKPLIPRGLFPENWKVGYPACKVVMMRLIVVFLLASSLVVKEKPVPSTVEIVKNNKKETISPGKARRGRGRPKRHLTSSKNNLLPKDKSAPAVEESVNSNESNNEETITTVKHECDNDAVDDIEDAFGNDADSNWGEGPASPDNMSTGSTQESINDDDVDYKPKHVIPMTATDDLPEARTQKRWNLRQRTVTSTVNFAEDSDSSSSEKDDKDEDPDAVIEEETLEPTKEFKKRKRKSPKLEIKPKTGRGWSRADVPTLPCPKCQKLFLDKRCLSSHLLFIHNTRLTHSCVVCGEKFTRWKELRNHRRAMHRKMKCKKGWSKKPRPCPLCPQQFSTIAALTTHRREVHKAARVSSAGAPPKPKKCPVCEVIFPSSREMKEHSREVHGDRRIGNTKSGRKGRPSSGVHRCKTCGEEFSSDVKLRKHRREALCVGNTGRLPKGRAKCAKCQEIFPTGKQLLEHRRKVHPQPGFLYQRAHRKRQRELGILRAGKIKCAKCEEVFPSRKLMMEHRQKEHGDTELPQFKRYAQHECSICRRVIVGIKRYENHLEAHKNNTLREHSTFYCEVCGKYCFKLESLQSHMRIIHNDTYSCSVCKVEFVSGKLLRDHLVTHEKPEKFFHCMECFRGFSCKQYFEIHRNIGHRDSRYLLCDHDLCNETFETVELLNTHLTTHVTTTEAKENENGLVEGNEVYTCKVCNKGFIKKYNFTIHELTHTPRNGGLGGYNCPVEGCDKTVRKLETLLAHYNRMHGLGIVPCKCYLCGKGFNSTHCYQKHIDKCENGEGDRETQARLAAASALHPDERKRFCRMCGEQFPNKLAFIEHKASNHPPKDPGKKKKMEPIQCPEENCNEMRTPSAMKVHLLRKHGKGDRYPCEKCGKLFVDMKHISDHMLIHEPPRFKCDLCDKAFNKPCRLGYHKLSVHAENRQKDYTCHLCGMSYYSQVGLKFHNYSKHSQDSELPFRCQWCGKGYGRKPLFTLHMKNCAKKPHGDGGTEQKKMEKPKRKALKKRRKQSSEAEEEEMSDKSTTEDEEEGEEDETVEEKPTSEEKQMTTMIPSSSATAQHNVQHQNMTMTTSSSIAVSLQEHHLVNPQMFSDFPYYSHDTPLSMPPPPQQRPYTPATLPSADMNSR